MITKLCREKIDCYDDGNARWRLANGILYEMVEKYPLHNNEDEIVSKMWMIGRTYQGCAEIWIMRRKRRNGKYKDKFI